ncbi:MAG: hypothetical protein JKY67_21905 [Pseudomonadales bacterium]|nr:hypothetical protein [Pseudomonadales bacterium]
MHYGYGAKIKRATTDIDFGIRVGNWEIFNAIKNSLIDLGFKTTRYEHRLLDAGGRQIDIVPFGEIEDSQANINWPPNGDLQMVVLGFQEAIDHAEVVRISEDPGTCQPVSDTY